MAAVSSDKVLIGLALVLALGSAGAFGTLGMQAPRVAPGSVAPVVLVDTPYTPTAPDAPPVIAETWAAPVAQARGREWIYDTFTPPEIFYNARTRQFSVKPPSSLVEEEAPQEAFGIELVSVRPEPFRLQLFGYVGDGDTQRGMFQNVQTGEVILGAAGHRIPKLGLTVKTFSIASQTIALPESMSTRQRVGTAVVRDEKAGRDITLSQRERVLTGQHFALLAAPGDDSVREVREGDSFKLGDATFTVEKVQLTPPQVEIVKESQQLAQPDRRTLSPREVEVPEGAEKDPGQ